MSYLLARNDVAGRPIGVKLPPPPRAGEIVLFPCSLLLAPAPMQLINMLSWWQWALLGAVPPALIALYFLKLRRQPLEVPSTFLWKRSIEDLQRQ